MAENPEEIIARAKANQAKKQVDATKVADDTQFIQAKVFNPFKTFFEGQALSVSASNDTGPFDILPKHHKFITLLNEGDLVVRSPKGTQQIPIKRGIMRVSGNKVVVYLGI